MSRITILHHMIIPAIMPVIFFGVALSPVELLGCRTRGLIALSIALVSGIAGLGTAVMGLKGRVRGEAGSEKWIISTLLLTIPVIAMLVLA